MAARCFGDPLPALHSRYNHSPRGIHYMDNAAPRWEGVLEVEGPDGPATIHVAQLRGTFDGDERAIGAVGGFSFPEAGVFTVRVRDPHTGMVGESNPVSVSAEPPAERLYWGDLHSQTYFSDGLRCPEELYHFARHEGFLDIFALADHSESLTDRQWEYFVAVTNDADDPGRFATLVGFEWTNHWPGHRNLYYPGDGGPILRRGERTVEDLQRLYDVAGEHGALLIPHHTANVVMGVEWEAGHAPEHERLVEIHSVWGNSERPASAGKVASRTGGTSSTRWTWATGSASWAAATSMTAGPAMNCTTCRPSPTSTTCCAARASWACGHPNSRARRSSTRCGTGAASPP